MWTVRVAAVLVLLTSLAAQVAVATGVVEASRRYDEVPASLGNAYLVGLVASVAFFQWAVAAAWAAVELGRSRARSQRAAVSVAAVCLMVACAILLGVALDMNGRSIGGPPAGLALLTATPILVLTIPAWLLIRRRLRAAAAVR
ncbi:hypothetical protein ET495_00135 [Xylanimonas allomyrinae]|uniref:Uncharacterized protein n=1 Tax=Xylanimonas allomyrinae TaxID=2509459 RepID=A0A4P6EHL7_9MICO|nr:hypothetical protein [Xylanimonas allomyrinae]QAY61972.1 hypothetical protein ET495_00135 [Xylanimonas allomyrinae]